MGESRFFLCIKAQGETDEQSEYAFSILISRLSSFKQDPGHIPLKNNSLIIEKRAKRRCTKIFVQRQKFGQNF